MDLITAVTILVQQMGDVQTTLAQLSSQAYAAQNLLSDSGEASVNPQIHALTATMNIEITAIHSQITIIQQSVDRIAELSA